MKKLAFIFTGILFFNLSVSAQARYVFIEFKDAPRPALQHDFFYPDKIVTNAIDEKLGKLGFKGKENKGYTIYRGVKLDELGNQPYDLYFRVERKSRRDKGNAVVTMLVSRGDEIFVTNATDSPAINNAKRFLNNLLPDVAAYNLQQQVNDQQEAISKAEKKYKNLQDDADDLQKKKKRIEQQIEDNLKAQTDQDSEVQKQKQLLETIKARQKN